MHLDTNSTDNRRSTMTISRLFGATMVAGAPAMSASDSAVAKTATRAPVGARRNDPRAKPDQGKAAGVKRDHARRIAA
jgi:hypothetical protein